MGVDLGEQPQCAVVVDETFGVMQQCVSQCECTHVDDCDREFLYVWLLRCVADQLCGCGCQREGGDIGGIAERFRCGELLCDVVQVEHVVELGWVNGIGCCDWGEYCDGWCWCWCYWVVGVLRDVGYYLVVSDDDLLICYGSEFGIVGCE